MAMGCSSFYEQHELGEIHELQILALIDAQQRDRALDLVAIETNAEFDHFVGRFAEFGLPSNRAKLTLEIDAALAAMPPTYEEMGTTYEELTKESDAVLQECDAMLPLYLLWTLPTYEQACSHSL